MVLPAQPPRAWPTFSIIRFWVTWLTSSTASMMRKRSPESRAIWAAARVSLGKQEPPKPGPACRNFGPIRLSSPIPLDTISTSAPQASQICATSLMKEILVARKPFEAYLISSAVSTSVTMSGTSAAPSGE